jgi:ParB/RepB/Spo0J family partition protein
MAKQAAALSPIPQGVVRHVPLAKCDVAEENARYGAEVEHVDELAASIKRHDVLAPLLAYELKGRYKIFAGARRLAALNKNGATMAPIMVRDRTEARALSLVENDQRVDMHPAEEAKAWAAMLGRGIDAKVVANAHGKSERFVLQRVKLAQLAPAIFTAFASDEISLELAQAYATAPADRQVALWKRFGKRSNAYQIKNELGKGKLKASDKLAEFVGRDAYLAAGGRIEGDLFDTPKGDPDFDDFDDDVGGFWLDRKIVDDLAAKKIDEISAKLKADGWSFVHFVESYWGNDYVKVSFPTGAKDGKSKAGCLISLWATNKNEPYEIVRGVAKRGSAASKVKAKPAKGKAKAGAPEPTAPITNAAHDTATRIASRVVGRTIGEDFDVAFIAMTAALVRIAFSEEIHDADDDFSYEEARVVNIRGENVWIGHSKPFELISDGAHSRTREAWFKKLPKKFDAALERELQKWRVIDLQALFAFCVGEKISHIESSPSPDDIGRGILSALGSMATAVTSEHWLPTKDWLLGLSREELEKAAREVGAMTGKTKSATAEAVVAVAAAKEWTPALLRELVGEAKAPAPAAAKKRKAA